MQTTTYKIYWTDTQAQCQSETHNDVSVTLKRMENLRRAGNTFVVMSSEVSSQVGMPGVAAVENGKTPDGHDYTWSKADRAGKARPGDKIVATRDY